MADNKFTYERRNEPMTLGTGVKLYEPGAVDLPPETKAFFLSEEGTVDVVNGDGSEEAGVPLPAGMVAPFVPKRITAASADVYLIV